MQTVNECSDLGLVRDFPNEMSQIQQKNTSLQRSNRALKNTLIVLAIGIGVVVLYQVLIPKQKDEEEKTG